ncbi:protein FAR1-RELATED SEQUENCE 5-like [Vicia villosa]|uniref:protein FAR1-RELATED SEQUENCE 5-like n=1 Tax=Vicia villosa TaxID=3911 RepID=UPI00273B2380|nr:protein FAR1-RELATED SEQUENCE 5-like [Vicia villosa]
MVAFDATFKKNKYNYPLVIFSECNHHAQTVIFCAALVSDETADTYQWLLECFLECMNDKYPEVVVTNGDGAMREAIKQVFLDVTHHLCAWHLNKNAGENVKNSVFFQGFQKAMYSNFTKDEFEDFWSKLIKEKELEGNPWALRSYRNNELVVDFKSKFLEPVMTTHLYETERHALQIYTAEIFKEVKDEIMKAGSLIVEEKLERTDLKIYKLTKYRRANYEVDVYYDGRTLQCECKLWDSRGIPCSHMFYVMKEEHIDRIPEALIFSRWIKDAKLGYLNMNCDGAVDSNIIEQAQFGAPDDPNVASKSAVGDPNTVKSKGAPKKKMTRKLLGDDLNATVELIMQGIVRVQKMRHLNEMLIWSRCKIDKQWAEFLGNYGGDEVEQNVDLSDLESSEGEEEMDENFDETVVEENGISFNYRVIAAAVKGKNVFHFPANVAENWLLSLQIEIDLVDVHTNDVYPCVMKTGRRPRERYLYLGWYEYV